MLYSHSLTHTHFANVMHYDELLLSLKPKVYNLSYLWFLIRCEFVFPCNTSLPFNIKSNLILLRFDCRFVLLKYIKKALVQHSFYFSMLRTWKATEVVFYTFPATFCYSVEVKRGSKRYTQNINDGTHFWTLQ